MESFAELLEQSEVEKKMKPGAILTGTVIAVSPEFVTVHAGLKSESTIPVEQFRDDTGSVEVHVGDTVEVALDTVEDGFGATRLSREKAKRAKAWKRLEEAFEIAKQIQPVVQLKRWIEKLEKLEQGSFWVKELTFNMHLWSKFYITR